MYKKMFLMGVSLTLSAALVLSCTTEGANNNSHYLSSATANNIIPSPTAVAYSPANVVIYSAAQPPSLPYQEITTIKVSLSSEYGIRRQQAQINQIIKEQASTLGGNAVITSTDQQHKSVYAKIIRLNDGVIQTSTSATKPVLATKEKSQE